MEHNFKWKNDGRTKVMIGCGTRPEIIRLAAVIRRCREYFDTCVVYYNQNWDRNLSTVFWEDFELKNTFGEFGPDILVPVVVISETVTPVPPSRNLESFSSSFSPTTLFPSLA